MLALDAAIPDAALEGSPWVYIGGAESERATLLTIATTTLSTAGIVFSLAVVPLSVAAGQYGSRLLRNFLRDVPTQAALGAFCGTFTYALTVLFSLPPEGKDIQNLPHLAVTGSLALALLCFVALVFFVHHVGASLQAPVVIDEVADDLERALHVHYGIAPQRPGTDAILSAHTGYVQAIDLEALADAARRGGVVLALKVGPGSYIGAGELLADGPPALAESVRRAVRIGCQRIPTQDIEFGVLQLVEVAVRALSPAINDPLTGINCLERLGVLLALLAREGTPSPEVLDRSGAARVTWPAPTLEGLTGTALSLIRQYGRGNAEVLLALAGALSRLDAAGTDEARRVAGAHAAALRGERETLSNPADRARLDAALLPWQAEGSLQGDQGSL